MTIADNAPNSGWVSQILSQYNQDIPQSHIVVKTENRLSEDSFRERYEHLTDEELARIVDVRKDLVPEAASALEREVERRHLKQSGTPFLTRDSSTFGFVVGLIILPFAILLLHLGHGQLVYPFAVASIAISFSIWSWWDLRRSFWFWATIGCFTLLHIVLILVIPWQAGWVPAWITMLASTVDLGIMYGLIGLFARLNRKQDEESST